MGRSRPVLPEPEKPPEMSIEQRCGAVDANKR